MMKPRFMTALVRVIAASFAIFASLPARGGEKHHESTVKPAVVTGEGVILVKVDPSSGAVTGAYMFKSTGSKILDDAAVNAWRNTKHHFKPGTLPRVLIPIRFTLNHPNI